MSIPPGEFEHIAGADDPETLLETNFGIATRLLYQFEPTYVDGVPNTITGPPTSGDHIENELWRDQNGAEFICTAAGTPGTWVQIKPAIVDSEPSPVTFSGYWILRRDQGFKHYTYAGGSFQELYLALTGGSLSGFLTLHADPSNSSHAATKAYVDAVAAGARSVKAACRVATTADIDLDSAPASIDGVTLAADDRVLVKDQTTGQENGIYVFNGTGSAMTRADDFDSTGDISSGILVTVSEGTGNADTLWLLTTNDPITLDTTALDWALFSTGGETNTGSNLGSGAGVYYGKSGTILQFRGLVGMSGITFTVSGNDVQAALDAVTVDDTSAPASDTGSIATILNNLANRLKAITGKSGWKTAPDYNLENLKGGRQTIWVPASAMISRTTNGPSADIVEASTNKNMRPVLDFDAGTNEYAQFIVAMPKSWNLGTVKAAFIWTAASGSGNVVWGLQGVAVSDDDATDVAFGTAQEITDGLLAAYDLHRSAESSAVTIAGTPAAGDVVWFQAYRNAASGSDTLAVDARLLGVILFYDTSAPTDD